MIYLITGVPGSGKSYYSVHYIYTQLHSKNPKYKSIYTNINLDFKKCDKLKKGFVKQLVLDDLLKKIEEDYLLSEKFKNNDLFDEETGEQIVDYDAYVRDKLMLFNDYEHSLIILDECHLYFTEQVDPKMLRFLSYHRHFDIDLFLITQNKSLINRKYLAFIENMYIAVNPSKRLFSKVFIYKLYASWKEYKSNYVGKEKLKFDLRVASLYNSGSNKIHKSLVSRILIPLFFAIVILFFLYKGVVNFISCGSFFSCSHHSQKPTSKISHTYPGETYKTKTKTKKFHHSYVSPNDDITDYQFFYQLYCFKMKCIVNSQFSVSYFFIKNLPNISDTKIFFEINTHQGKVVYLATNLDLSKFNPNQIISGGKKDEKDNILPFGSRK
jgi:zona occludens toxin